MVFQNVIKLKIIGNLLYVFALILVTIWSIVFIGYRIGGLIHILLVISLVAVILRFFLDKREAAEQINYNQKINIL